jgi:hypothetical protein
MGWVYLLAPGLVLWGLCGATMAIGRRVWSLDTALHVHLAVAPVVAFVVSAIPKLLAPEFGSVRRATAITGMVIVLDIGGDSVALVRK